MATILTQRRMRASAIALVPIVMLWLGLSQDVTFSHCNANDTNGWGGAFYLSSSGVASLIDSRVQDGSAYVGGGIYNDGGVLTLTRTYVGFNRAVSGGGIYNKNGSVSLFSS